MVNFQHRILVPLSIPIPELSPSMGRSFSLTPALAQWRAETNLDRPSAGGFHKQSGLLREEMRTEPWKLQATFKIAGTV